MRIRRALKDLLDHKITDLRCSSVVALLACFLIVALVIWGTAYKISLYHPEAPQVVQTKMFAGDGPLKRVLSNFALISVAVMLPWLLAFSQRQATSSRQKVALEKLLPIPVVSTPSHYFRPPPARRR